MDYKLKLVGADAMQTDANIIGYADADWGGNRKDLKSTSGHCSKYTVAQLVGQVRNRNV